MIELAIPFKEIVSPFPTGSSWEKFRSFSPTGLVPCLQHGDEIVWDSLAIAEYLAEQDTTVWPASTSARAWARCAAAERHSGFSALRNECPMSCGVRVQMREVSPGLNKDLGRIDELWQQGMDRFGGPFLAGDSFTAVDAFYAPVAFRIRTSDLPLSEVARQYANDYYNCHRWLAGMMLH
jgi:glutathione S-transferase